MALSSYLRVNAESQGDLTGSVTQAGREETSEIFSWTHEIVSARDKASGAPTGKRQHKPLVVRKALDSMTPGLWTALVNNENLPTVSLELWRPSRTGAEQHYYKIELTNGSVSKVTMEGHNNKVPENMAYPQMELIEFSYERIDTTWIDGGIAFFDDWQSPQV